VEPKEATRSASFSHSADALDASGRRKRRRTHSLSTSAAANSLPLGGVDFGAADDPLEPDSVTQCLCGHLDESEYMIQCERCHAWQHGECVGISQEDVPEQYLCYGCIKSNVTNDELVENAVWWKSSFRGRLHVNYLPPVPPECMTPLVGKNAKRSSKKKRIPWKPASKNCHLMIARTSRGIVRDHGVLQRCLRAIRLHANKLTYDNSPDAVAKLQQLETQQFAIESFLEALITDDEALALAVATLTKRQEQGLDISAEAGIDTSTMHEDEAYNHQTADPMGEINRLFKKYNSRQWKTYVDTAVGKVLR